MKIIVTAGGTLEPIDDVRSISNHSTGRMGTTLAKYFLEQECEVIFVANQTVQHQLMTASKKLRRITITDVKSVMQTLEELLTNEHIDAVVHTMAVSDYTVYGVCAGEQLDALFASGEPSYQYYISQFEPMINQKLSSSHQDLFLRLTQTPKIIQYIKKWQPDTLLIGFKLLVNADLQQFQEATLKQQQLANSDYVVANDLQEVNLNEHHTMIYNNGKIIAEAYTREDLAELLWQIIQRKK